MKPIRTLKKKVKEFFVKIFKEYKHIPNNIIIIENRIFEKKIQGKIMKK
jgi:hypothetical protein